MGGLPLIADYAVDELLMTQVVYEFCLACVSVFLTQKHVVGAKKLTDVGAYHAVHSMFCLCACLKELWTSLINPVKPEKCSSVQRAILEVIPQLLFYYAMVCIFFYHWERALVRGNLHRHLKRPRMIGYIGSYAFILAMCIAQFQVNDEDDTRCLRRAGTLLAIGGVPFSVLCSVDLTWLTWNVWASAIKLAEESSGDDGDRARSDSLTPEAFRMRALSRAPSKIPSRNPSLFPTHMSGGMMGDDDDKNQSGADDSSFSCFPVNMVSRQMPHALAAMTVFSYLGLAYLLQGVIAPDPDDPGGPFLMFKLFVTIPLSGLTLVYMWFSRHLSFADGPSSLFGAESALELSRGDEFSFFNQEFQSSFSSRGSHQPPDDLEIIALGKSSILCMDDNDGEDGKSDHPAEHDEEDEDDIEEDISFGQNNYSALLRVTDTLSASLRIEFHRVQIQSMLHGAAGSVVDDLTAGSIQHRTISGASLVATEELGPSPVALPLARLFARHVALPALEQCSSRAQKDVTSVLTRARPSSLGGAVSIQNMEKIRLYKDLGAAGSNLMAKYSGAIQIFQALADSGDEYGCAPIDSSGFKPSKAKKLGALAPVSTNLHVHKTTMRALAVAGERSSRSGSDLPPPPPAAGAAAGSAGAGSAAAGSAPYLVCATALTVGAPAAHAIGFKHGGLREVEDRLRSHNVVSNPDEALKHLQLKFVQAAREHIVVSQALGAVGGAAVASLTEATKDRNEGLLRQWSSAHGAGLLVHSVCLLTTAGKEHAMLDDFAGAYERLDLSLRLGQPHHLSSSSSSSKRDSLLKGRRDSVKLWGIKTGPSNKAGLAAGGNTWSAPVKVSVVAVQKAEVALDELEGSVLDDLHGNDHHHNSGGHGSCGRSYSSSGGGSGDCSATPTSSASGSSGASSASSAWSAWKKRGSHRSSRGGGGGGGSGGYRRGGGNGCGRLVVVVQIEPPEAHAWAMKTLKKVDDAGSGQPLHLSASDNSEAKTADIRVVPLLFNLGVNEMQTIANAKKHTAIQTEINRRGVEELVAYHGRCAEWWNSSQSQQQNDAAAAAAAATAAEESVQNVLAATHKSNEDNSSKETVDNSDAVKKKPQQQQQQQVLLTEVSSLLSELKDLVEDEAKHRHKNVDLLLTSCFIARLLNGARTTSCKSAKDRTSVFHTLEMAWLAARAGLLKGGSGSTAAEGGGGGGGGGGAAAHADKGGSSGNGGSGVDENDADKKALDGVQTERVLQFANELRGPNGVRLKNCELNVGKQKYAFNVLQQQALPVELRPPPCTAGSCKS